MKQRIHPDTIKESVDAVKAYGTIAKAAEVLGIPRTTLQSRINHHSLADGYKVKGTSTLYDEHGNQKLIWVKTTQDIERQKQMIEDVLSSLKDGIKPTSPIPAPEITNADLISCYVLTDYHIGQFTCAMEGQEWDTDKAADFLSRWFETAMKYAPDSHTAVLAQLGDFLHYDGLEALTPTSKHVLDSDARYAKIVKIAITSLRMIVENLLKKHQHVHIIMAEGNHDLASSVWLRQIFKIFYGNEPRVTVDDNETGYYAYECGKTSLFFHHGHKRKLADLSRVFASVYREMFGRTEYSYAHMGHLHHVASKEDGLMFVEQHPTMAVKDSHSIKGGYNSKRGASVITYTKDHGEFSRVTIRPEMVK